MIVNHCDLLDPNVEPTDEQLEWLMRGMMADVRLSQERIRQKLADQIEEQIRQADQKGKFMDAELWSLRNKLEDVLEALKMGDLASAHVAALELSTRLSHAVAAWERIKQPKREGWAEASKALAESGEDKLVWSADAGISEGEPPRDSDSDSTTQTVTALKGLIRTPASAVTIEAMNEAIAHQGARTLRIAEDKLAEALIVIRDTYGTDTPVWLFGSRADESKRGGDVDLFVQSENRGLMTKTRCRRRLMEILDLKVDLIVGLGDTPIQRIAVKTGVRIN